MFTKYLDPKNDLAFKKIFGEEKHKNIPISFLNAVFHLQGEDRILDLEFINTIQPPAIQSEKESVVDLLVKDQRGSRYIVEMQVSKTPGFEKRAQYYAAKTYGSQLGQGGKYASLKEIVFLAITSYVVFPNKTDYKSEHVILDKKTYEQDLKDFSFTFVELPKFTKKENELKTIEDQWYYFFKHAVDSNHVIHALATNSEILDAYDIVERFGWTEQEIRYYDNNMMAIMDARCRMEGAREEGLEEGRKEGLQEGLKKGLEEGMQEERKKIIQNLVAKSFPLATISEITGYSEKEIASVANSSHT